MHDDIIFFTRRPPRQGGGKHAGTSIDRHMQGIFFVILEQTVGMIPSFSRPAHCTNQWILISGPQGNLFTGIEWVHQQAKSRHIKVKIFIAISCLHNGETFPVEFGPKPLPVYFAAG